MKTFKFFIYLMTILFFPLRVGQAFPMLLEDDHSIDMDVPLVDGGSHTVGNGGGLGEQYVTRSILDFLNMGRSCDASNLCKLEEDEIQFIKDLGDFEGQISNLEGLISFANVSDEPLLIDSDGKEVDFAITDDVDVKVIFNRGSIYQTTLNGQRIPISMSASYVIVGAALAKVFLPDFSERKARRLGAYLGKFMDKSSREIFFGQLNDAIYIPNPSERIILNSIDSKAPNLDFQLSSLLLKDGDELYDVSQDIAKNIDCNADGLLWNIKQMALSSSQELAGKLVIKIKTEVHYLCDSDLLEGDFFELELGFQKKILEHGFIYKWDEDLKVNRVVP